MNLKEAFRYQNKLQALMDEAQGQCRTGAGHEHAVRPTAAPFGALPAQRGHCLIKFCAKVSALFRQTAHSAQEHPKAWCFSQCLFGG